MKSETARGISEVHAEGFGGDQLTLRVRRRDDLILRRVQRELLLLDAESNQIHQLNETASFIWDNWEQNPNAVEIANLLAQEFDVREHMALNDVSTMISRLRELNLLVV